MEKKKNREIVITHFSAVYIFDSRFSEEEVDEIAMGEGMYEMRSWKKDNLSVSCEIKRYCPCYLFDTWIYDKHKHTLIR